jgi:hypothetical protein
LRTLALVLAGIAVAGGGAPAAQAEARLQRTADGWALVAADESIVYAASGAAARYRCLERARKSGVLRIVR